MASIEELRAERLRKLESLTALGVEVYPTKSARTHEIDAALAQFESLSEKETTTIVAGRVMGSRGQGALIFPIFTTVRGKFKL